MQQKVTPVHVEFMPPIYNPQRTTTPQRSMGVTREMNRSTSTTAKVSEQEGLPSTYVLAMQANGLCTRLHFEHLRSQYPSRLFSFCENKTGRFLSRRATPFVEPKPLQNYSAL